MKSHRATGRPRGRPPSLPFDLDEQVLRDLESRMDKTTLLVTPSLSQMARRLKVSLSSIKRVIVSLRNSGYIELCYTKKRPTDKVYTILYKLLRYDSGLSSSTCGS
jgi:Mn-dependent DtxR family transcriptional regulator